MIPFRIAFEPGVPIYEQVVYAAKKAIVAGEMRPGEAFPSVRQLSRELKINPNTAHRVVMELTSEGLLEIQPGIGTVVARRFPSTGGDRRRLMGPELEKLVVEARRLGLQLEDVVRMLREHWKGLDPEDRP